MKILRPDQSKAIDDLRHTIRHETNRVVLQFPTGAGKTVVAADIIRSARAKNKKALVTVPALELVDQTVQALVDHGVNELEIGVIQADHHLTNWANPIQVASVQTLLRQPRMPDYDIAIVDEVHRWFHFFEKWFAGEQWRKTPIIGLSATPWYKGLGAYFDKLIIGNTIGQMIVEKTLVPFKVYAASHPDLDGVRSRRDTTGDTDYVESDLAERMGKPKLVADAVEMWKQLAEGRPTICFAVNRDHAAHLAKEFENAGVSSGYMDCDTPKHERKELRRRFLAREVKVVCNVDVIGLGVDWPEVSCISYCRPTRSEMRYVQNIGRGLRPDNGKDDLVILDHSDSTLRLGFVSDIIHDELHDGKTSVNGEKPIELPKECPQCHYLKPPRTAVCPACGHEVVHHAKEVKVERGTLKPISAEDIQNRAAPVSKKLGTEMADKARVYGQLLWHARKHGYRDGYAIVKYKEIYGTLPWPVINNNSWKPHFRSPEMELASWIKSRNIKYAKGKGNRWSNGNGHGNGHAHEDDGALPERAQAMIDRTAETLMKPEDWDEMR